MRTGIKRSNIIESKFAKLWISKSCRDWECALEEYWQNTHAGEREVRKALRKTLFKYKLHQDSDLFDRAYGYIARYY